MSGHSKWNNIKRKKEGNDAVRGKIFTKIGREMTVAVHEGGPDPVNNSKLAALVQKAKANNIPNDNIDRTIKKAAGLSSKETFETIVYEGYGPCGIAVIIEALTDNRNRTAGDIRHCFDKWGGNLGTSGCVAFLFDRKGVIVIEDEDLDEDKLMEDVMEVGGEDYKYEDGVAEIYTDPNDVANVASALQKMGYVYSSAEPGYLPQTLTALDDEHQANKMTRLLEYLDDNDDVQNVWHNWDQPDDEEEE